MLEEEVVNGDETVKTLALEMRKKRIMLCASVNVFMNVKSLTLVLGRLK